MVSMKDIAKQCNVSVASVSKALNGYSDISEETRQLILKTASEMGYLPNSSARALKTRRSYNLGVLFVDEAMSGLTHDYFNHVLLVGAFLGNKLIVNEFVAFQDLGKILSTLDYRTGIVCSISLCGFANLSSLGICVSGIAVLCPEKKSTLSRLVFRAMLGGVFVSILSAMIVGLITLF